MTIKDIEYIIKDENNLRKKCEKALSIIPNNEDCSLNFFPIKKERLNEVITKWQLRYPGLKEELEDWRFVHEKPHETITLRHMDKKIECVYLKICNSEMPDLLNCISASKNFPKQNKILKVLNKLFKHSREKFLNQLIKSQPKIVAALILSGDNGLRISWN